VASTTSQQGDIIARIWRFRSRRLAVAISIILLPLLGLYVDRHIGELVTELVGPAVYCLYVLVVLAYTATILIRLPSHASLIAAGILAAGAAVAAAIALLGTLLAVFLLILLSVLLAAIALSPWLTSFALAKTALDTWRTSAARLHKATAITCLLAGVAIAALTMGLANKADADWLRPRLQPFQTDDVDRWERSLQDIRANWFCGHRRCLMPICMTLMQRFGKTTGRPGPFAVPFGFAFEAPNVPAHLAEPFSKVYGYPVQQVCVIGD